jgi:hypothetical protein
VGTPPAAPATVLGAPGGAVGSSGRTTCVPTIVIGCLRVQIHRVEPGFFREVIDQRAGRLLEQCFEASIDIVKRLRVFDRPRDRQKVHKRVVETPEP